jgi:pyruvate,water dikinase
MTGETTQAEAARSRFPSPSELAIPSSCHGWEEMYPYHVVFDEGRRAFTEGRFWFHDSLHAAEALYPFDTVALERAFVAFNQASSRLFVVPPSLGCEWRLLNGYLYISPTLVDDEATLARRAELFARRGGYYYEHWDELYAGWKGRVEAEIRELDALAVPHLPELEDESVVTGGGGLGSSYVLLHAYGLLFASLDRIWQYHFEFLNLGYGAYAVFYEHCRQLFPDIDEQTIAKMVSGIDVLVLRPDEELRRLAARALELGVDEVVRDAASEDDLRAALSGSDEGTRWLADLDETKDPWFNFSAGNAAWYHDHRSWVDDPSLPLAKIGSYVDRLRAGEDISLPRQAVVAERDRITEEHRALVGEEALAEFDAALALSRTVYPFVEDHSFYIDHWYFTIFWNKVREFGALLRRNAFIAEVEDVFYLRHGEVREALEELRLHWSAGGVGIARGPGYWPAIVERRRSIHAALREWTPPPALGAVPESISDPVLIMLWGLATERLHEWLAPRSGGAGSDTVIGVPGSAGVAEGRARVILSPDQLRELEAGEILVAPSTSTSWTPVFGTIAAAVLDSGGMMCHAAIVAREYGLPAVVGTGTGTSRIRTGDRLHVDANAGVVTILRR